MANNIKTRGKPPTWKGPEEVEQDFTAYIDSCYKLNTYDKEGNITETADRELPLLPTVTGFCMFKGITRETFYCYSHKENYTDTFRKIDLAIEELATQRLVNARNPAGTIFYLKNKLDWADKREITTNSNNVTNVLNISSDQLDSKIAALLGKGK